MGLSTSDCGQRVVRLQKRVSGTGPQKQWQALGKHMLLDVYHDDIQLLDDVEYLKDLLHDAARVAETEPLSFAHHRFEPQGVSCCWVLAESHISVHTWPQFGHASFDIYTCGGHPEKAAEKIIQTLKPRDYKLRTILRGGFNDVQRHIDQHFEST